MSSSASESERVNVFRVPHSRMKELVNSHLRQVDKIQELSSSNLEALETLLQAVYEAMWELKSHEYIENHYIMDKLKARLQAKKVYNQLVCNCHEDSKLLGVIKLVEQVYASKTEQERDLAVKKLQGAISDFLDEFLHHMEEEEKIFQPLLDENFEKTELATMNEIVLKQHSLFREKVKSEKSLKAAVKRKYPTSQNSDSESEEEENFGFSLEDLRFRKSYCQEVKEFLTPIITEDKSQMENLEGVKRQKLDSTVSEETNLLTDNNNLDVPYDFTTLPEEVLFKILTYMNPKDLLRLARVNKIMQRISLDSKHWKKVYPAQWSRGHWTFEHLALSTAEMTFGSSLNSSSEELFYSEQISSSVDAVDDHFFKQTEQDLRVFTGVARYLLPKVGRGVTDLVISGNHSISNGQIRSMLMYCPNLKTLDLSYTKVGSKAFRRLDKEHANMFGQLKELIMEGCPNVDDTLLENLRTCFLISPKKSKSSNPRSKLKKIILSGCHKVTPFGLAHMEPHQTHLEELDLSGCYKLDGETLTLFVTECPKLKPHRLSYCNDIEDGPYPTEANGCQNLECAQRFCCQQLVN